MLTKKGDYKNFLIKKERLVSQVYNRLISSQEYTLPYSLSKVIERIHSLYNTTKVYSDCTVFATSKLKIRSLTSKKYKRYI